MKTIGYLRLSKDDENDCESTSITNQRKIITNFANDKGIKIDDWYVDDGYRLAADKETLYSNLGLNIDIQYSTWCMTNNVTIDIILNISRFGSKIKYKSKKLLF